MQVFELKYPISNIQGVFIEKEDFEKDPARIALNIGHVSVVFFPEQYKSTYMNTNLWHKLMPCVTINGVLHAKIFFYSPSFNLDWEWKDLFEILHGLEGETKIFEDKYPTYFLVILCEKDIMFLGRYTGKLFSEFNKSEPIGYIGRRNSAREVRESAEKMMIQIKAGTK